MVYNEPELEPKEDDLLLARIISSKIPDEVAIPLLRIFIDWAYEYYDIFVDETYNLIIASEIWGMRMLGMPLTQGNICRLLKCQFSEENLFKAYWHLVRLLLYKKEFETKTGIKPLQEVNEDESSDYIPTQEALKAKLEYLLSIKKCGII